MNVQLVHVFSLTTPKKGTVKAKRRYRVKWRVDDKDWSQQFRVKAQAERLRSQLLVAVDSGERFDSVSGRPVSWNQSELTWFDWTVQRVELKCPGWAGKSRYSGVEVVTVATPELTKQGVPAAPENVRWWLRNYAYHPDTAMADDEVSLWLERWSLPLVEVTPAVLEKLLGVICVRQDGKPTAANTAVRYKNMIASILTVAVKHGEISSNPMDRVTWKPSKQDVTVDNSVLPTPSDVESLVVYTSKLKSGGRRYAAFFATCGFAGMRPSEVSGLE